MAVPYARFSCRRVIRLVAALALAVAALPTCGESGQARPAPAAGTAEAPARLLKDLPRVFVDYAALRAITEITVEGQALLIDTLIQDPGTSPDVAAALRAFHSQVKDQPPKGAEPSYVDNLRFEALGLTLVDPRRLHARLADLERQLSHDHCPALKLAPYPTARTSQSSGEDREHEGKLKRADVHNLVIYYVKSVLQVCGKPVDWSPVTRDRSVAVFFDLFRDGEHFRRLDEHLSDFDNQPFMRSSNTYVAVYFLYLQLAFEARSVDFPRWEFVARRTDLWQHYPDMKRLNELLAALVWRRLA